MKKILVVFAHPFPNKSRANRKILESLRTLPNVTVNDLYEKYPHFHIDVKKEKQLLLDHEVILFQHPFYWYNMPPLLKLWFDEVFELGFAYGPDGTRLKGKEFIVSITAGGPFESYTPQGYNNYSFEQFLPAYIQTAQLCQMLWKEPIILHGVNKATSEELKIHADKVKNILIECSK